MRNPTEFLLALSLSFVAQTPSWAVPIESFRPLSHAERYFEPHNGMFLTHDGGFEIRVSNEGYQIQTPDGPITMNLLGAHASGHAEGLDPAAAVTHYARGNRPHEWRRNVPRYSRVRIPGVYPGIDIVYHHDRGDLEFDLHVSPGTDPDAVVMQFEGVDRIELSPEGDLLLHRGDTVVWQRKPAVFQIRNSNEITIAGRYAVERNRVSFVVGDYDRSAPLVIDPEVSFSSIVGRNHDLGPVLVGADLLGNVYLAGTVYFPYTTHPVFEFITSDLFVTKLDPNGNEVYTLFFGGNARDILHGFHVDGAGNLSLVGETLSADFPTVNAAQPRRSNNELSADAFVTRMTTNGGFVFSSYLGGSGADSARAVVADSTGNVFVTGTTESRDFPVSEGVLKTTPDPVNRFPTDSDAFVTKLAAKGGTVVYSTRLGGEETGCLETALGCVPAGTVEQGLGIAVDATGNAFVAGITNALDFPVSPGAYQTDCACDYFSGDAFIAKLNSTGSALLYGTFLGGIETEGFGIIGKPEKVGGLAVDSFGNAYVVGATPNENFPTTPGAYHPHFEMTAFDLFRETAFVAKLNSAGTELIYSTFLSGKSRDRATGVSVDHAGRAYVVGTTNLPDYPVSAEGFSRGGDFISVLSADASNLEFSSLLPSGFQATGVATRPDGEVLLAGASGYVYRVAKTTAGGFELPAILGTANAAALEINGRVSPGSLITIFGKGIGPDEPAGAQFDESGKISKALAGTEVLFDGAPSPITYAQSDQVNAIVPFFLQPGEPRKLTIRRNGVGLASTQVHVVAADPAIFRILDLDPSGVQPAAALNQDGTVNSAQNPAKLGSIVAVFGTGFGPLDGTLADGEIPLDNLPRVRLPVSLIFVSHFRFLPDVTFPIHYAGQAPGLVAGVMQVNFEIPSNAAFPSNVVLLDLKVGDQSHSFAVFIGR